MWVRPILTMASHAAAFVAIASCSAVTAGTRRCLVLTAAAIYIADGNVSLEDCDMLTWSFGCTGVLLPSSVPASWQQRLEITSFTFMLNWVPLPVIHTCRGNMSSCWPARISSQTRTMSLWRWSSSRPPAWFAFAAAFFRVAYAAIISRGIRSLPMLKCSSDRCVCAPHSLLLGTSTSPRLSVSLRTPITFTLLMALIGFLPSVCLSVANWVTTICARHPQLIPFFGIPLPENPIANVGRTIHEFDTLCFTHPQETDHIQINIVLLRQDQARSAPFCPSLFP